MDDALALVAEPRRRAILRLVWDRELSAGEIARAFDVTFSAVSQHLAKLRGAGFLGCRKEGRHRYYRARPDALGPLAPYLEIAWAEHIARLKALAEEEAPSGR